MLWLVGDVGSNGERIPPSHHFSESNPPKVCFLKFLKAGISCCFPFCFLLSQLPISLDSQASRLQPMTPRLTYWASGCWVSCAGVWNSHLKPSLRQMHVGTHPQTTLLQPRLRDAPSAGLGVLGLLLWEVPTSHLCREEWEILDQGLRTDEHKLSWVHIPPHQHVSLQTVIQQWEC